MAHKKLQSVAQRLAVEHRRNPWMLPGIAVTASLALGTALPDLIELAGRIAR